MPFNTKVSEYKKKIEKGKFTLGLASLISQPLFSIARANREKKKVND